MYWLLLLSSENTLFTLICYNDPTAVIRLFSGTYDWKRNSRGIFIILKTRLSETGISPVLVVSLVHVYLISKW